MIYAEFRQTITPEIPAVDFGLWPKRVEGIDE
jgi:hypothetical protein